MYVRLARSAGECALFLWDLACALFLWDLEGALFALRCVSHPGKARGLSASLPCPPKACIHASRGTPGGFVFLLYSCIYALWAARCPRHLTPLTRLLQPSHPHRLHARSPAQRPGLPAAMSPK